ncbi:MAG: aldo/keto reductase [Acidobacteria bacterium]|nr:aldo/keto reductase [Acidobacteriota bacterium]
MPADPSRYTFDTNLGRTGRRVFRLGLSGSYWPGEATLRAGIEGGMNYLFWYHWDRQMTRVLREVLSRDREKYVVATGVSNLGDWVARHGVHSALRKLKTDYIDVFHIFWLGDGRLPPHTLELLQRLREQGKIRHIAVSTHARHYAGELVRRGVLDVLMMRYNAAHRGAEEDIFPFLPLSQPGVVSYTATRWGKLLQRPRGWTDRIPTAGDCYRFVLSNPHVDVCLTAPRNARELEENLAAVAKGPLAPEEDDFMRRFGDAVHRQHSFFL